MLAAKAFSQFQGILFPSQYQKMYMQKVKILITSACELRCLYCFNDTRVEYPQEINRDIYTFLDALPTSHKIPINFAFGEPLLALDKIREVVKDLNDSRYYVIFNTSGYGLKEEHIGILNELPAMVSISCDGPASIMTRGFDFVKNGYHLVGQLKNFSGFVSVITPYSYNPYLLQEYFSNQKFTLNRVKTRCKEAVAQSYNLVELREIYKHIVNVILMAEEPFKTREFTWIREYIDNYLFYLANPEYTRYPGIFLQSMSPVLDLAGTLYYSTYYQTKLGDIYDCPHKLNKKFLEMAASYWECCNKNCLVKEFCMGGVGGEYRTYNMCSYMNTVCECLWPIINSGLLERYIANNYIKDA